MNLDELEDVADDVRWAGREAAKAVLLEKCGERIGDDEANRLSILLIADDNDHFWDALFGAYVN